MLILWILLIIAVLVLLRYLYLIVKRLTLIIKIKKKVKMCGGELRYCRNPLTSLFRHDGKADFIISEQGKSIALSVITIPFRRVRCHFENNMYLELIVERRGVYVVGPMQPKPSGVSVDRSHTLRKYRIKFDDLSSGDTSRYVVVHPAPLLITKTDGAEFAELSNDDILFHRIKICGLRYFIESVI